MGNGDHLVGQTVRIATVRIAMGPKGPGVMISGPKCRRMCVCFWDNWSSVGKTCKC